MNLSEITSVPVIVILVYCAIEAYKRIFTSEKSKNLIPVVTAGLGCVLGILIFYLFPTLMPAENVITAIVIGMASGLGATGGNQIVKQFRKLINVDKDNEN